VTHTSPFARRHLRRNWIAFFGDYVFFGIGLTFASTSTILPAFAAALTDNKILIGATSAIWTGGWLLPQIFAAHYLSDKPHKWPIMFWGELIGRPIFALFVVWLLVAGPRYPSLTLLFFFITITYFVMTDAVVALAWFDMMGKALAPETRGRMIGVGQVVTGIAALGAGALIRYALSAQGPAFPYNYALILGMASAAFTLSEIACALIVEPSEAVADVRPTIREFLPQLARLLGTDVAFGRITLVRLLAGLGALASTFYVLYATQILNMPPTSIGLFAGAATIGTALAGILLGVVADRLGTHRVVQIVTWCQFLVPALALLFHLGVFGSATSYLFPILYVLLGIFDGSVLLGFLNYVLEISPPGQRPTYMGLTNTLSGLLVLVPLAGGWILEHASYPLLFGLAAVGTLAGALLALGLPSPRRPVAEAATPTDGGLPVRPGP
jgi:Major Facilitator Superfamily